MRGVLLPFPTPFDEGGAADVRAVRANIKRWNETGATGYVALGSTGERVHLDDDESRAVVEAAREAVPREMSFVVGVGQQSTRGTIVEARAAAAEGADALLVLTPHFYRPALSPDALAEHYRAVADASPVPVVLYSMPELTGLALAPETVARLSEHENIVGLKDSSGDIVGFAETLRLVPEEFAVLTGSGALLYAALSAGAPGAILAVGCVAPRQCVELYEAFDRGDHRRARELQRKLAPLTRAVVKQYGVGGLKAALGMIGYEGGRVRAPLRMPGEAARREIKRALDESGFFAEATIGGDEEHLALGARTT